MRPKIKLIDEEGRAEVKAALAETKDPALRVRLQAVRLAYRGQLSLAEIAETVGRARSKVAEWISRFRAGGVAALRLKPRGGTRAKNTKLDAATQVELLQGLREGRWKRAKDIRRWLNGDKKVPLKLSGLYTWLRRRGAKPKVPRKSHAKKDAAKASAFRANLASELAALGLPPGRPVRIWVADEHRYGLISVLRKVWTLRGCRPTAPYHTKYQWGYLYSALEVAGAGRAEALFAESVCLEMSHGFLAQLAATDPQAEHVVIWDQAGFHQKTGSTEVPARVHILSLPPYSPELNPVEKLGDLIKDRIGNVAWSQLKDIEQAIAEELGPIWRQPERVRALIGEGWLLDQANASSPGLVPYR